MNVDTRIWLYGSTPSTPAYAVRGANGRFVRRATPADLVAELCKREGVPAPAPATPAERREAFRARVLASRASKRNALIARVHADGRRIRSRVHVTSGDLYQNPNLGKRDAWGHVPLMPRTRNTPLTVARAARVAI